MPKGVPKNKDKDLVKRMDEIANALLSDLKESSIETRLSAFSQVARWVAIRNKIADGETEGATLSDYRAQLEKGPPSERAGSRRIAPDNGLRFKPTRESAGDDGGPELEALKSRLPPADDLGADEHRGDPGDKVVVNAGPMRVIRTDLHGPGGSLDNEAAGDDEF